jgi:hypothetical protein
MFSGAPQGALVFLRFEAPQEAFIFLRFEALQVLLNK